MTEYQNAQSSSLLALQKDLKKIKPNRMKAEDNGKTFINRDQSSKMQEIQ